MSKPEGNISEFRDPRLSEHVTDEEAARFLRGEMTVEELMALPSIEEKERQELFWWKKSS